ncbi:hypothetical protein DFH07DRAFT_730338, partial [Mycena maculata]
MRNRPDQSILIAQEPAVAARFFNIYIKAFIAALGYDPTHLDTEGGILGVVSAYYGCVEAQGRGTLHCHMMIWVEGGLNPNEIKERALENGGNVDFQQRLMAFLEDTICNSLPPEGDPNLATPLSQYHPCATRGPPPSVAPEDKEAANTHDFHCLAKSCQYHVHTRTCYKYWKGPGYEKECRFDLDESNTRPVSVFDPVTGVFELRCLEGLVNSFNETMLETLRCNMDIKFISSGTAAKAVMYYITNYITKSQLQAHVAYAALELAATKLGGFDPDVDEFSNRARRLLQKCAHAMTAQQELSGQQVASYIMGFEDHFTSHKYVNVYWPSFEGFINAERPSPECYKSRHVVPESEIDPPVESEHPEGHAMIEDLVEEFVEDPGAADDVTLSVGKDGKFVASANQTADYQQRG